MEKAKSIATNAKTGPEKCRDRKCPVHGNVKLRKKDQLVEFEKLINIQVNTLDNRMGNIKRDLEQAQELILKIEDPEAVSELNKKLNLIKDEINHFKVTADLKTKQ